MDSLPADTPRQALTAKDSGWGRLIQGIVRPPRFLYDADSLGSRSFTVNNIRYRRVELEVLHQGKRLAVTLYEPAASCGWVILYLHGNSSSRLECTSIMQYLPETVGLASFDFLGCGNNHEEDVITLGIREAEQVRSVVEELRSRGLRVALWGRSMGAATALKFGDAQIIVADSSFRSFRSLCREVLSQHSPNCLAGCLVGCFFPCLFCKLRSDIRKEGNYDIGDLQIRKDLERINPSTLVVFLSGEQDNLIAPTNSSQLFKTFKGPNKHLLIFEGTHQSKRPPEVMQKVMGIIAKHIEQLPK